jgi:hypothetical protein
VPTLQNQFCPPQLRFIVVVILVYVVPWVRDALELNMY